ncbi:MAG TPA: hypothetical protein PL033_02930 [Candidatus Brocadiia bacterium]|nr:hypothetical protein [Candidatus Brocadiia bacterium]
MKHCRFTFLVVCALSAGGLSAQENVGKRPYEMEWAGRTEDTHPALIDFESIQGWKVETGQAQAKLELTREQQLWGKYVAKLTYRGAPGDSWILLKPPAPIPVAKPFDCVNFWIYGNNWGWMPDPTTPEVIIEVIFKSASGREVAVNVGRVNWQEWWVMRSKLLPEQKSQLAAGASLVGIRISNASNKDDRMIFLDNLSVYTDEAKPLKFEPRPERNLTLFPGQSPGTNTGPGELPFPTREETILPTNLAEEFKTDLTEKDGVYTFAYSDAFLSLNYMYKSTTGKLDDVQVECQTLGYSFRPMTGGGVFFNSPGGDMVAPERFELVECKKDGDTVVSKWKISAGARSAEVTYVFRLWQKSLVVDAICPGGGIGAFRIGGAVGAPSPRLVTVPYMCFSNFNADRPAVLVMGTPDKPLFATGLMDWYRSNASQLVSVTEIADGRAVFNGGSVYRNKTDGKYNDCYERLFLTVSPHFKEVLPNIPNPKSPWMHVAGERLWHAHGATNRESDYAFWKNIARHGMTKVVITDHETGWRDGGESFTFRTRTAPGKGGDESQKWYSDAIQKLGFVYGIYNNYTDFAPVNEHWDEDCVTLTPEGQWRTAWPRCYNPKPSRAVELEARLAPIIQQKFNLSTAYCDVHTAVSPWDYCDYDHRVPGGGTFAATFYSYGEIMLHQKKTWNGPVYSEGGQHWYYCGLTDGNYGQDTQGRLPWNPWLVDFDMLKLHPQCCNFGMGNLEMFFGRDFDIGRTLEERDANLNRFLAATIAFGHTGYLVRDGGMRNTVRSYFMLQQLHKNYAQENAVKILYADADGKWRNTTSAVATDAFRRSHVATTYANGLVTVANGNRSEWLKYTDGDDEISLPPNGYYGCLRGKDGKPLITVKSGMIDGHMADYAETPEYIFADGRDIYTRFPKMATDKALIALFREGGKVEVIPVGAGGRFAVALDGRTATAEALDEAGKRMGRAVIRLSRGLCHITPVDGAFSYVLTPQDAKGAELSCARECVVPGETVEVKGKKTYKLDVPPDAKPGETLWRQYDSAWIDFPVRALADVDMKFAKGGLEVSLKSNLAGKVEAEISAAGKKQKLALAPEAICAAILPVVAPDKPGLKMLQFAVKSGDLKMERTYWISSASAMPKLAEMPSRFDMRMRLRGGEETAMNSATGANAYDQKCTCGEVEKKGIAMHPPWMNGVGYSALVFDPVTLPDESPAAFRCQVGKRDGSYLGDGVLYKVAVLDESGAETELAKVHVEGHKWLPLEADLSKWAGKRVRLKLIVDVGVKDDSSGDWAAWADMRIETLKPTLVHEIENLGAGSDFARGPFHRDGVKAADLKKASRGWLRFKGCGIEGTEQYAINATVNDAPLGRAPAARGSEANGEWAEVRMPLPDEAIRTLGMRNIVKLDNVGRDFYKVKDFWIELEMPGGKRFSSMISARVFTQPIGWPYSEGTCVSFEEKVETELRFETEE